MGSFLRHLLMATAWAIFFAGTAAIAQDREALKKLALEVPLADVHLHLYPGLSPQDLLAAMDRNNVRWGGAVGPILPGIDPEPFIRLLGKRYVPAGAQPDMSAVYFASGTAPMVDAESAWFKALLPRLKQDFEDKKIRGIGELILNNRNSHPIPTFRRKVPINAPTIAALFSLAEQYEGFVQIHMEDDNDSIEGLQLLLARHPKVPVILSHCMARAQASVTRALLEKSPNLYCETSARSSVLLFAPHLQQLQIHNDNWLQPAWLALMEAMPDRFMIGSDATSAQVSYDALIKTVRTGLLANLSEGAMRKIAYENAQRVLKLQNPD